MAKKDFSDIYEAIRTADKEGRADDVAKLTAYLEAESAKVSEEEDTYDPKNLVSSGAYAGAGAGSAVVGPAIAKKGMEAVEKSKQAAAMPKSAVTVSGVPGSALADIEEATTKGLSNEVTQQTRTAQRAARTENMSKILAELKAKGVPVNPNLLAEAPAQVARPGSGILLPVERAKEIAAGEDAAKAAAAAANAPKTSKLANVANFIKGATNFRIPFTQTYTGPLLGRGLVGAGSGMQFADMLNRNEMGDTTGAAISGIGGLGTAASLFPYMPARVLGTGVGLTAEAINAYRDAMRRGNVTHGAPENYDNVDAMGNTYAQGGLAHLAAGGSVMPDVSLDVREMPSMTGMPGVGYMQTPQAAMARMQLEKELEMARLRAGVSGMGMAIPGQHGVKLVPGQMDIGANIPLGRGNLDISANRSINPIPGRGHQQGVNARYTLPFAEGGGVKKSDANEGAAFIGYPQINKNRKVGSGTGFLDALVGAPASRTNVLNPSDYSYMEGYEKGEPYGIAAMTLPFVGMAAKPLAKEAATRAFMGEAMTPKMMRGLMPEQPVTGIFRNEKGGNWAPENLTQGWTPEMQVAETLGFHKNDPALENWVNTQLTRYMKNEMGSPEDSIRKLADQGILHFKPRAANYEHNGQPSNLFREAEVKRGYADTQEGGSALSQLGKDWEANVDAGVTTRTVSPKFIEWNKEEFPWIKNAEGKKLHSIDDEFLYSHLGFDHMVDVLREQIASGALRPESMKSLSVPQAVQRVHEYNLAKEKAMEKVKLQANAELPVHKEYPEGYKWQELKHPTDSSITEQTLKYEGDAMGHCVGGYCPEVIAGKTKIYSLRDAKGAPHVTIEVRNRTPEYYEIPDEVRNAARASVPPHIYPASQPADDIINAYMENWKKENPVTDIVQIKGKQNAAPKAEYQPFVQDFVRSGKWARIGDVENAGLLDVVNLKGKDYFNPARAAYEAGEIPRFITQEELDKFQ